MAKILRGSATLFEDGSYVFNPYEEGSRGGLYLTLCNSPFGQIRLSKNKIYLSISMERKDGLTAMKRLLLRDAMELLASLESKKVMERYARIKDNLPEDEEEDEGEVATTPNAK